MVCRPHPPISAGEQRFRRLVGDEEERRRRRRAGDHGPDALVHARPPAAGEEAAGRLETRFERVERVQCEVYCRAGDASGLFLFVRKGSIN